MQHKRLAFGMSFASGIGLLALFGASPYASAQGMEPDVSAVPYKELAWDPSGEPSVAVRERVNRTRERPLGRL